MAGIEHFMWFTITWVMILVVILAVINTIWKNIGCIFVGAVILIVSIIMYLALGNPTTRTIILVM